MSATAHKKTRSWLSLIVASVGLAVVTGSPASAAAVSIDLCAKPGTVALPDAPSVPIWGFALKPADLAATGDTVNGSATVSNLSSTTGLLTGMQVSGVGIPTDATIASVDDATTLTMSDVATADGTGVALTFATPCDHPSIAAQIPGPQVVVDEGDVVTINVTNVLPPATPPLHTISLEVPGVSFAAGSTDADVGATVSRTFTASAPGTYLYQSAGDAGRQVAMGLYGALIVRPTTGGQAYGPASTAFDVEKTLVLSTIDPAFNADPDTFDLNDYLATYWLVNGQAHPDTPAISATAGQRVLLRYVNAGFDNTSMMLLGMHQRVVARDANLLNNPYDAATETIPAGGTEDTIAVVPSTAPPSSNGFPLFNRNLHVTNGTASGASYTPGGMLIFITP
jgi:FtsP/CotA-like multicopper oxidase with cupredoxin domain